MFTIEKGKGKMKISELIIVAPTFTAQLYES